MRPLQVWKDTIVGKDKNPQWCVCVRVRVWSAAATPPPPPSTVLSPLPIAPVSMTWRFVLTEPSS